MLVISEPTNSITHNFKLNSVNTENNKITYQLISDTYANLPISFTLESPIYKIFPGYTVSVYLFKNQFFNEKDIIDLRINDLEQNGGRVGYFFRLDALFEINSIQLNKHTYSYAYHVLEYIFSNNISIQTKIPEIKSEPYQIKDFFDDDTIVLVLCDQYTANIVGFNIENYLPELFLNGFIKFSNDVTIESFNNSNLIQDAFSNVKKILRRDLAYVLRVESANKLLLNDDYLFYLYAKLIQKRHDPIARFIILYQVVEIMMSKVLQFEIKSEICPNVDTLTSVKLKEKLEKVSTERKKINFIVTGYSIPLGATKDELKKSILDFFVYIKDDEYLDASKHGDLDFVEVFYDYRNKLVHNYRQIHNPALKQEEIVFFMEIINIHTEIFVSELIINLKDRRPR